MPLEGYITKDNKTAYLERQEEQRLRTGEESAEAKSYRNLEEQRDRVLGSKRTGCFSGEKEDSALMKNIKEVLNSLTDFYTEKTIAPDKESFEVQLSQLDLLYKGLIEQCNLYLQQRNGILKKMKIGQGYARYCMVKKILAGASVESSRLHGRAQEIFRSCSDQQEEEKRPLWVNVLAETRAERVDFRNLGEDQITVMGGNTSSVIQITTADGTKGYIKENGKNESPDNAAERYSENMETSPLIQEILAENEYGKEEISQAVGLIASEFLKKENGFDTYFLDFKNNHVNAARFREPDFQKELRNRIWAGCAFHYRKMEKHIFQSDVILKIIGEFGEYYYKRLLASKIATHTVRMEQGSSITKRNVATWRLAELLGMTELIPASRNIVYKDRTGKEHTGIIMSEAKGQELRTVNNDYVQQPVEKKFGWKGKILLQLNSLQIMDLIAGQIDRHSGNIMAGKNENGEVSQIMGIDNDMSFGKLTYEEISGFKRGPKPMEKEGKLTLKLIDRKLYDHIMALTDEMLHYAFADILSPDEMKGLLNRFHGVRKLLKKVNPEKQCVTSDSLSYRQAITLSEQKNAYTELLANKGEVLLI